MIKSFIGKYITPHDLLVALTVTFNFVNRAQQIESGIKVVIAVVSLIYISARTYKALKDIFKK